MELFGLTISRTKTLDLRQKLHLSGVDDWRSGWWPLIRESSPGAWQRNELIRADVILRHPTVFACVNKIQKDIGKMALRLMEPRGTIHVETESPAYSPFLRKPNHFQTRQQFIETWVNSKIVHGNTYTIKQRDQRGVVVAGYVLDPTRVHILLAPDGSIFYDLQVDELAGLSSQVSVPAREIFHDRMPALFHPLVGVSPLFAAGAVATEGLTIQENSSSFFANGSQPGGIILAPTQIKQQTADRIKAYWETAFTGTNAGKVGVLGDNLKYEQMKPTSATDSQLIEQVNWIDEKICSCFDMPPHKVGVGDQPNYNNIEALNQQYWSECLQPIAEPIQTLLEEGLNTRPYVIRFNLTDLLRMDTPTRVKAGADGIKAGFLAPNEVRRMLFDLPPVEGGDTPYLQQQDYSLSALNRRDEAAAAPDSTMPDDEPDADLPKAFTLTDLLDARDVFQKDLRT